MKHLIALTVPLALAFGLFSLAASAGPVAKGNAKAGQTKAATCAACHGADGNSTVGMFPRLAGQSAAYIYEQLQHFKNGTRKNPIMKGMASRLSDQDMRDLAAWFSSQTPSFGATNPKIVNKARALYLGGRKADKLPACAGCHGPRGAGQPAAAFPRIGGQHAQYVAKQLHAFKDGSRKGVPMNYIASKLSDQDIQLLASYVQGLH